MSGRPTPGDTVDRVTITAGRWWQAPGEIVLDQDTAARLGTGIGGSVPLYPQPASGGKGAARARRLGRARALAPTGGGQGGTEPSPARTLTVVGIAASVSTPDVAAWMSPDDLAALTPGVAPARRCSIASIRPARLRTFRQRSRESPRPSLPSAVTGSTTYLEAKADVDSIAQLYVPILLAFSIFALLAAGFTIANVVSGIVLTSYRDIGVMKAVGFTPVPGDGHPRRPDPGPGDASVPSPAWSSARSRVSRPSSGRPSRSGCRPRSRFRPSVVALVLAVASPSRCSRRSCRPSVPAASARSTRSTRGTPPRLVVATVVACDGWVCACPSALPGAARRRGRSRPSGPRRDDARRPARRRRCGDVRDRDERSLLRVMDQLDRTQASPVRVELADRVRAHGTPDRSHRGDDPAPGVPWARRHDGQRSGLATVPFVGYDGDASWIGYELIAGRWFAGPGEVVAPHGVLHPDRPAHRRQHGGHERRSPITVRLVGEIFDTVRRNARSHRPARRVVRICWSSIRPRAGPVGGRAGGRESPDV